VAGRDEPQGRETKPGVYNGEGERPRGAGREREQSCSRFGDEERKLEHLCPTTTALRQYNLRVILPVP
jgi:hypothetical protein